MKMRMRQDEEDDVADDDFEIDGIEEGELHINIEKYDKKEDNNEKNKKIL